MFLPLAVIGVLCWAPAQSPKQLDWSASAEAVFMTSDETRTWKRLRSDDERERFKTEYWRRRDASPQTDANEFQALIHRRSGQS
jgi:GWxTD domain-containing protein